MHGKDEVGDVKKDAENKDNVREKVDNKSKDNYTADKENNNLVEDTKMANQKVVEKQEPNSPRKVKPLKPPKPANLASASKTSLTPKPGNLASISKSSLGGRVSPDKKPTYDLSLQATSYSFGKKKNFVSNTQKQREVQKGLSEKDLNNKKTLAQKGGVLSPIPDARVPPHPSQTRVPPPLGAVQGAGKSEEGSARKEASDTDQKSGSLTINLFLSDDALAKSQNIGDRKGQGLSSSMGRQLSVQVPLDQLDLLQSLPTGKARPLPEIGDDDREAARADSRIGKSVALNKSYPPPRPRSGSASPQRRPPPDLSQSMGPGSRLDGAGHTPYQGQRPDTKASNPRDVYTSYQSPAWVLGQTPKTPGRPELPPISNDGQVLPPSMSYNFSHNQMDGPGMDGLHYVHEAHVSHRSHSRSEHQTSSTHHRKKKRKHKHHRNSERDSADPDHPPRQQSGDEKVMHWLEQHQFDEPDASDLDPEMEGRQSGTLYRQNTVVASRPGNMPGIYANDGAAISGAELPDVFTPAQMLALKQMQAGMLGVDRYVGTPRAWNQDIDTGSENYSNLREESRKYPNMPPIDRGNQPITPSYAMENHNLNESHRRSKRSQYTPLQNPNQACSTPRTSRTLRTETSAYSDPVKKSDMGTQAGGPNREETFYVSGTPHRSIACSTEEDKNSVHNGALGNANSVGTGTASVGTGPTTPRGTMDNNSQLNQDSGFSTLPPDQAPPSISMDTRSQVSTPSSMGRGNAIELRSKNLQILKVVREEEELENCNSAQHHRRTAQSSNRNPADNSIHIPIGQPHDDIMSHDQDSGFPGDEGSSNLDALLGDDETYVVFLKTSEGAVIGPFQLDIDSVHMGLPTPADILGPNPSQDNTPSAGGNQDTQTNSGQLSQESGGYFHTINELFSNFYHCLGLERPMICMSLEIGLPLL